MCKQCKFSILFVQERVVATLAYTNMDREDKAELVSSIYRESNVGQISFQVVSPSEAALQQKLANNPVHRAYENVHDVDALYRIADLWLNPASSNLSS